MLDHLVRLVLAASLDRQAITESTVNLVSPAVVDLLDHPAAQERLASPETKVLPVRKARKEKADLPVSPAIVDLRVLPASLACPVCPEYPARRVSRLW